MVPGIEGSPRRADNGSVMTAEDFRVWRRATGLTQAGAAEALGLKRRMIQYYEHGARDGRPVDIPRSVRLACWALSQGVADFDGVTPRLAPRSAPD
jgi:transcriptional regulator with XRE-family HTH domain